MYSAIEHLARSLWLGRFAWSNRMAMYSAYFDESGHPDDSRYLIVAGAVADVVQWVHLEREWKDALAPLGSNVLFHSVDFDKGNPPFDQLNQTDADRLYDLLVGIILRRTEKNVSSAVVVADHKMCDQKYIFSEAYGFPYPLAARSSISAVEQWAAKHALNAREFLYFLENGAKHKGQLEWMAERDHIPIPKLLDKTESVPLQVGDLLAWLHHTYLTERGKVDDRYSRALERLVHSSDWKVIDLTDPDRLPTILGIPLRDPTLKYKLKIVRTNGVRKAVVQYWPKKNRAEPKLKRNTLTLPEPISREQVIEAAEKYDATKGHP